MHNELGSCGFTILLTSMHFPEGLDPAHSPLRRGVRRPRQPLRLVRGQGHWVVAWRGPEGGLGPGH